LLWSSRKREWGSLTRGALDELVSSLPSRLSTDWTAFVRIARHWKSISNAGYRLPTTKRTNMADWQRFRPRRQQDKLIVIVLVEGAHRYRYTDTNTQMHRYTRTHSTWGSRIWLSLGLPAGIAQLEQPTGYTR